MYSSMLHALLLLNPAEDLTKAMAAGETSFGREVLEHVGPTL